MMMHSPQSEHCWGKSLIDPHFVGRDFQQSHSTRKVFHNNYEKHSKPATTIDLKKEGILLECEVQVMNVGSFFTNNTPCAKGISSSKAPAAPMKKDKGGASSPAKQNRQQWWQKSVIRRSTSLIQPDIDKIVAKSPFLQKNAKLNKFEKGIALFKRHEILIGSMLGKGGFSHVYEIKGFLLDPEVSSCCSDEEQALREAYVASAYNHKTKRYNYCVKHLQERLLHQPKDFQCAATDLAVEAAFMSALDHSNILKVRGLPFDDLKAWDDGRHDGFFIISDRLEETLDKEILSWRDGFVPSMRTRCSFALELASALRYLHDKRIIFRDLKPHNIGFTRDGDIKLFDFGLCRELPVSEGDPDSNEVFQMSGVGTRRYMACEIINTGRYNLKADVYSWSMIFWEMLGLRKPYAPYSTEDHRREVCRGGERPSIANSWPAWIHSILRMSWEEDIDQRFSMEEVYENLRVAMCHQWEITPSMSPNHKIVRTNQPTQPGSPTAVADAIDSDLYLSLPKMAQLGHSSLSYDSVCLDVDDSFAAEIRRYEDY